MKRKLTDQDRSKLKQATRMGYLFGSFLLVPVIGLYISLELGIIVDIPRYLLLLGALISLLISWLVNRKYWIDLRNSEKEVVTKTVTQKQFKEEFEAGSSVGFSTNGKKSAFYSGMNTHIEYHIIVENTKYRVEKGIWDALNEKDEVEFHYGPRSGDLLDIRPNKH